MLMSTQAHARLTDTAGLTLVEMMIAICTAAIVMLATFSLIEVATDFSSRVSDRVDAAQQARAAMEQLIQELNSGCLASDVSPVQASSAAILSSTSPPVSLSPIIDSDGSDLVFVSAVGDGATATPTEHVVSYNSTTQTLTDKSYAATGGWPPSRTSASRWTFGPTPVAEWQLTNVTPVGGSPLFQYFAFGQASSSLGAAPIASLPLSATWPAIAGETNAAYSVAQVNINWRVGPTSGSTDPSRWIAIQDSVVFRLTPASSGSTNYPCA